MRLASHADFQNGPIYTRYPLPPEVYAKRARLFHFYPEPILVVGCGFGGLVQALIEDGKQVWGIDASPYAIENRTHARVVLGNILDLSGWQMGQFATLITEDLLPHLTDEEVLVAARNCQAISPIVIHMVTEQGEAKELIYRTAAKCMNLTNQPTVSLEGM